MLTRGHDIYVSEGLKSMIHFKTPHGEHYLLTRGHDTIYVTEGL